MTVETSAKKDASKRSSFRNPRREVENANLDRFEKDYFQISRLDRETPLFRSTRARICRDSSCSICKNIVVQMSRFAFSTVVSDFGFDRVIYRLFSRSFFVYRRFSDRATFRAREVALYIKVFLDCVS